MYFNLKFMMFSSLMLMGIILSICSNNWIIIWCGLELNLICFVPMMVSGKFISSESCMKYFIVQSLSSSIFIMAIMMNFINLNFDFNLIINMSLMMKMGVAPFHNWVLSFINGLEYNLMFLFFTVLKLPPLVILSYLSLNLFIFVILTLMVGSILGLMQNSLSKIIGCSSIFNLGFMISCVFYNSIWLFYLIIYSLILFMLIVFLYYYNLFYINQMIFNDSSFLHKVVLLINLLSMGGMPPMAGFMIKLISLELMLYHNFYFISFMMIMFSLLVMFFYIRISFTSILIFSSLLKYNFYSINFYSMIIILLNVLLLPLLISLVLFF